IYRAAHNAQQVADATAYLRHKWTPLFPDSKSVLTAFVGNSMTTGMFCGSGQTWTYQTASKIPALTRWLTISQGGITTPGVAENPTRYHDLLIDVAANAEMVDQGAEMDKELYVDGVHPSARGNAVLPGIVIPQLTALLKVS